MVQNDIHDYRPEQRKTERNVSAEQQKRASDNLKCGDDFQVASGVHRPNELTGVSGDWWHRKEVQERVRSEHHKHKPEQYPHDYRGNFHAQEIGSNSREIQPLKNSPHWRGFAPDLTSLLARPQS